MEVQLNHGKVIEYKQHSLSGKEVRRCHPTLKGHIGTILGIRVDAKDASERYAFVIEVLYTA